MSNLLSEFEVPSFDQWKTLVEKDLQGASFEKKYVSQTPEGIELQPLYVDEKNLNRCDQDTRKVSIDRVEDYPASGYCVRGFTAAAHLTKGWDIVLPISTMEPADAAQMIVDDSDARGESYEPVSFYIPGDRATCLGKNPQEALLADVGSGGVSLASGADVYTIMHSLPSVETAIHLNVGKSATSILGLAVQSRIALGSTSQGLKGSLGFSPLSMFLLGEINDAELLLSYRQAAGLIQWTQTHSPDFIPLALDSRGLVEAGASAVEEIAFLIAMLVELSREMLRHQVSSRQVANSVIARTGIGSNYFVEISKQRALRKVYSRVVGVLLGDQGAQEPAQKKAFNENPETHPLKVHAFSCAYDKTILDEHVNILRLTAQGFAAVLGGVDKLTLAPFNELSSRADSFSRRLSRNIQLILQEESNIHRFIDPAGGSYFVEHLTEELAEKSWALFQQIESMGGLAQAIRQGIFQDYTQRVHNTRRKNLGERRDLMVGVSIFPNLAEASGLEESGGASLAESAMAKAQKRQEDFARVANAAVDLQLKSKLLKEIEDSVEQIEEVSSLAQTQLVVKAAQAGATVGEMEHALRSRMEVKTSSVIKPLVISRLSSGYEKLRLNSLCYLSRRGIEPSVFLANIGPLRQHKARADFAQGFFEPAGFKVIGDKFFIASTPAEAASDAAMAASKSGALIAVLCSTDETYPELVPVFAGELKKMSPRVQVVLAGYPKEHIQAFKELGVDEFIHIKADNLSLLEELQVRIGVAE